MESKTQKVPLHRIRKSNFSFFTGEKDNFCPFEDSTWLKAALLKNPKNMNDVGIVQKVKDKDHSMTDGNLSYFKLVID